MHVEIVELPPVKVAAMRYTGPYGEEIGVFWDKTFGPWLRESGLLGSPCYGIGLDDPHSTPPEQCRYDACVEVPDNFKPFGGVELTTLPGGHYAMTKFHGAAEAIGPVWEKLFTDWLPQNGYEWDARPCFEYYPRNWQPDPCGNTFACDLYLAIKPRQSGLAS